MDIYYNMINKQINNVKYSPDLLRFLLYRKVTLHAPIYSAIIGGSIVLPTAKTPTETFRQNMSNDAVLCKDVPFMVIKTKYLDSQFDS